MRRVEEGDFSLDKNRHALLLLGEELKMPLVSILQVAELTNADATIGAHASKALKTIDNMLLYQRIHSGQTALRLEPVHIGSTIQEVAHGIEPLMRAAGCRTELHIQHGLSTVDADRRLLSAALYSLWQAFIDAVDSGGDIVCRANRTKQGIRVSLQSASVLLDNLRLSHMRTDSSQPITALAGASTDLYTAREMFVLLGGRLNKTTGATRTGLGVTLPVSRQLSLVS